MPVITSPEFRRSHGNAQNFPLEITQPTKTEAKVSGHIAKTIPLGVINFICMRFRRSPRESLGTLKGRPVSPTWTFQKVTSTTPSYVGGRSIGMKCSRRRIRSIRIS
jgi:hypothetical protein